MRPVLALGVALRQYRADHQLDLMEEHQRQDQHADGAAGEQHLCHGHAGGQALLRPAEEDGDAVLQVEAQPLAEQVGQQQRQGQQHAAGDDHRQQRDQRHLLPEAADHRGAEGGVDHQQDRTLVDVLQPVLVLRHPAADPALGDLAEDERQQQLQADLADGVEGRAVVAVHAHQHGHQQRRDEDAQQAGGRRTADRRCDIAACQGGEGDGRLHRGWQRTEVEHAHEQLGAQQGLQGRAQRQPEQREEDEGAGKHQQVQAPVTGTGDDRLA